MAGSDITVRRFVKVDLDVPGTIQGLIDQLVALTEKPAIGIDSQVQQISGGGIEFQLILLKPEN
jgi:hypothetical protein